MELVEGSIRRKESSSMTGVVGNGGERWEKCMHTVVGTGAGERKKLKE